MEAGKKHSPIVRAIRDAEKLTTGEIRVHLSHRAFERDPYDRALKLFHRFGMGKTTHRNAVLLYVNLRKHKFAIIGDEAIHKAVGQEYWEGLARELAGDLRSTHPENALALAIRTIGVTLNRFFPRERGAAPEDAEKLLTED